MSDQIHLALELGLTQVNGRWRTPGSWIHRPYPDVTMFEDLARLAERACLDMVFFGDGSGIPGVWQGSIEEAVKWGIMWPRQDMSPYLTAMARVTRNLGFGITYSSTYLPPFYLARLLSSLDEISNGRIAFNVVSSSRRADAANYGFDALMSSDDRYEMMEEFIDVCRRLWNSVGQDAFIWDRETGIVADPAKVHAIDHAGKYFQVAGPLNCVPSPQGQPVLIQAGSSPRGIQAAAKFAELVFASQPSRRGRVKYRADLDAALSKIGRNPNDVGILFHTAPLIGDTLAEAEAMRDALMTTIPKEAVGPYLSDVAGYDLSTLPDRFTPREINDEITAAGGSPVGLMGFVADTVGADTTISRDDFYELTLRNATGYARAIAGTAASFADWLEEEFEAAGSRGGFMLAPSYSTPRDVINIVDRLVPELQRRGRFRTKYEGRTLRENLAG